MIVCIGNLLSPDVCGRVRDLCSSQDYAEGNEAAERHRKLTKHDGRPTMTSVSPEAGKILLAALQKHDVFRAAAYPRSIRPMLLSRYEPGMSHGLHVDDAVLGPEAQTRADISITVFLNDAEDFEGGELVIDDSGGEHAYKLNAGSAIIYPSNSLHRVAEVTAGVRLVAVTWVQSLIRSPEKRELLFDLDQARRDVFDKQGRTPVFDKITKSHANLLRMWAEV